MATRIQDIEKDLWSAADELRANSKLSSQEYSVPVLGLIFLRYADYRFTHATAELEASLDQSSRRRRQIGKMDYQARGVLYLPEEARFSRLLMLPEGANVGEAINNAMRLIEEENSTLKDVLPKQYLRLANDTLVTLLKRFHEIPMDIEGDIFGRIYEYFLAQFAMGEGRRGGEFFTPVSLVRLIVEIIEPFHGRLLDPACGSGGMFVQSARFVREHAGNGKKVPGTSEVPGTLDTISIYGQERVNQTIRLCQMNLAVHGLEGNIKQANTFYEDAHNIVGKFDFVMANPPFNVNNVDKERLKGDKRYPLGLPNVDNANYLWIQLFYSALNERGRTGFIMANSASDARHSEETIREKLLKSGAVDVMVAIGSNFFYTVTLPCTLWFLDRGKSRLPKVPGTSSGDNVTSDEKAPNSSNQVPGTSSSSAHQVPGTSSGGDVSSEGKAAGSLNQVPGTSPVRGQNTVLFIDARRIYRQVSRAHRDFTPEQLDFIADIVRMYRGQVVEVAGREVPIVGRENGGRTMADLFPGGVYADVAGLCKVATLDEIGAQGWSLNPGRYVGVMEHVADEDFDFFEQLEELNEELETLNIQASKLEDRISQNVSMILEEVH